MTRITVDADLRTKLLDLKRPLELCDEKGRVLARVLPLPDPTLYDLEPKISREELERRKQSKEWYTTEQVLKHLENL